MRSHIQVDASTEISIDDARNLSHFLRVQAGPARVDLSLQTAAALHDLLNDYFGAPDPEPVSAVISEAAAEVFDGRFDRLREAEREAA